MSTIYLACYIMLNSFVHKFLLIFTVVINETQSWCTLDWKNKSSKVENKNDFV